MMSAKYLKLTEYLTSIDGAEWRATFQEIEQVLGFPLPDSARAHQAWWSNQMRSQSLAWQSAGWKTTALDLENERVTFVYVAGDESDVKVPVIAPMTIQDAKIGLAATFGVDPEQVEITIRA